MAQSRLETLDLHRADSGHDLWPAVEAAQYARLIEHDDPLTDVEAARMRDLIDFFSTCAEQWEGKPTADQAVALEQLELRVTALKALDLSVYWAVMQGRFATAEGDPVDLPVAVLSIAHGGAPSIAVCLPTAPGGG